MPTPLCGSPQRLLRGLRHVPTSPSKTCSSTATGLANGYTSPLSFANTATALCATTTATSVVPVAVDTTNRCLFAPLATTTVSSSASCATIVPITTTTTSHQRRFCCSAATEEEGGGGGGGSSPQRRIRIPLDTRVVDIPQPNSNNITVTTSIIESAIKCERGVKSAWAVCKGVHDAVRGKGIHAPPNTASTSSHKSSSPAPSSESNRPHLDATIDTIVGEDALSDGLVEKKTTSATATTPPPLAVKKFAIKSVRLGDDYLPLSTFHPAFHQFEASPHSAVHDPSFWANKKSNRSSKDVATAQSLYEKRARHLLRRRKDKQPLSTAHPVFGAPPQPMPHELFSGPVYISGFFLAVDPNFAYSPRDVMNPNARLTIRDKDGNFSRARYKCHLESDAGFKLEAIVRLQVGWISPHAIFSELPTVIALGKGFDVSIPGLFQFTMVNILDETGCSTGSCLYLSGTPTMGFSLSFTNIARGRLVLNPTHEIDPSDEKYHFFTSHRIHYRQFGFLLMKMVTWGLCIVLALPMLDVPNHIRCHIKESVPQPYSRYMLWLLGQPRCEEDAATSAITSPSCDDDNATTK